VVPLINLLRPRKDLPQSTATRSLSQARRGRHTKLVLPWHFDHRNYRNIPRFTAAFPSAIRTGKTPNAPSHVFPNDLHYRFFVGTATPLSHVSAKKMRVGESKDRGILGLTELCLPQIFANHHLTSIISQPSSSSRMQLQPNNTACTSLIVHMHHVACLPQSISPPQFLQQKRQSGLGNRGEAMPCLFSKHCRQTCGVWCNVRRSNRPPLISQSERPCSRNCVWARDSAHRSSRAP
jgi:hypothetical protein